jgi:hypothetical protein
VSHCSRLFNISVAMRTARGDDGPQVTRLVADVRCTLPAAQPIVATGSRIVWCPLVAGLMTFAMRTAMPA